MIFIFLCEFSAHAFDAYGSFAVSLTSVCKFSSHASDSCALHCYFSPDGFPAQPSPPIRPV